MADIDNNEDIIDSRDVIKRLAELESERSDLEDEATEAREAFEEKVGKPYDEASAEEIDEKDANDEEAAFLAKQAAVTEWDADNGDDLKALKSLDEQASGYASDWRHGASLIRDSHFQRYAEQTAEDLGLIQRKVSWPYTCIDWEKAAYELQMDYTSVDYDGVTYWIR